MKIAVACAAGSAKGVYVHGVLSAFQDRGVPVEAYAAASSSTIPAAFAAAGRLADLGGAAHWERGWEKFRELGDVSQFVKWGIAEVLQRLRDCLFLAGTTRFLLAASHVTTSEAADKIQGGGSKRLGLDQLRAMKAKDVSRAKANLVCHLFDTKAETNAKPLTEGNLADALYATTRMLHAWREPGWIDGRPYIDASYTCMCPAVEIAELGYNCVIAISPEAGPFYRDLYQSSVVPAMWKDARVLFVQPPFDLKEMGVDYLSAQGDGLQRAYDLGRERWNQLPGKRCVAVLTCDSSYDRSYSLAYTSAACGAFQSFYGTSPRQGYCTRPLAKVRALLMSVASGWPLRNLNTNGVQSPGQ